MRPRSSLRSLAANGVRAELRPRKPGPMTPDASYVFVRMAHFTIVGFVLRPCLLVGGPRLLALHKLEWLGSAHADPTLP